MNDLLELVEIANRICQRLDRMADDERKFSVDVQFALDACASNMCEMKRDLIQIQNAV